MTSILINIFLTTLYFIFHDVSGKTFSKFVKDVGHAWSEMKSKLDTAIDCMASSRKPSVDDVKFYLFSPKNAERPEEIRNLRVNESKNFDDKLLTKVLIHGYTQSYRSAPFIKMKDVYMATQVLNVIMVNWMTLAYTSCYPIAVDHATFVGQLTGYLLGKLHPDKVHIIGFSLGAHIAGLAGEMQIHKVLRITGLDPAGPMFLNTPKSKRLDSSDAQNVDVIHTSLAGDGDAIGHADFYVNGGKMQPSCTSTDVGCSHRRSLELYLESITSNLGFKAIKCDSLNHFEANKCSNNIFTPMGEPWLASGALRGMFYVRTNLTAPFALDQQ